MNDIEILQASYDRYKDKLGRKAVSLKIRIDGMISWQRLLNEVLNRGIIGQRT